MNAATPSAVSTEARATTHVEIEPSILYFGRPVVLLSTENRDGSCRAPPCGLRSNGWHR